AGLVALREPIIALLYEHGRFSAHDTARTAAVLSMYAIGLYAYAAVKVLAPAFYALQEARVPLLASVSAVVCNILCSLLLYQRLGAPGLALGTSVGALVNLSVLYTLFVRRRGSLGERDLLGQLVRVGAAAAVMGVACRFLARWLEARFVTTSLVTDCVVTLVPVALGVPLYFGLAWVLRLEEARLVWRRFARRARA
ncbi:MAG TPA: lipid II flippase MurJ, partial [Candidatus Krumholzibacteria bacterium]|nr:lipid II flippase MurJ [Candidatus Krumholzibacteria bacterium]